MTTATLAATPATGAPADRSSYVSLEALFARVELGELASELGRALDAALFLGRLRSDLEYALDLALLDYDLEQLSKAEAIVRVLAA